MNSWIYRFCFYCKNVLWNLHSDFILLLRRYFWSFKHSVDEALRHKCRERARTKTALFWGLLLGIRQILVLPLFFHRQTPFLFHQKYLVALGYRFIEYGLCDYSWAIVFYFLCSFFWCLKKVFCVWVWRLAKGITWRGLWRYETPRKVYAFVKSLMALKVTAVALKTRLLRLVGLRAIARPADGGLVDQRVEFVR